MAIKATAIKACKECGSTDLTWQATNTVRNGIQNGRLTTQDVQCLFFLGCDYCSETLATICADEVAELLNAHQ